VLLLLARIVEAYSIDLINWNFNTIVVPILLSVSDTRIPGCLYPVQAVAGIMSGKSVRSYTIRLDLKLVKIIAALKFRISILKFIPGTKDG
jgi:hypothetical protein